MRALFRLLLVLLGIGLLIWLAAVGLRPADVGPPPGPGGGAIVDPGGVAPVVQPSATGSGGEALPFDGPTVQLRVERLERYLPPPVPLLGLVVGPDGRPLPARPVVGVGAGFDAPDQRGLTLAFVPHGDGDVLRQLVVDGETAPALVGSAALLRGSVRDADGAAVRDAVIWAGERRADGSRREFPVDDQGRFEIDAPMGPGGVLVAEAPGRASSFRVFSLPSTAELELVLAPAAPLRLQVVGSALALTAARVFVVPRGAVSTELSHWPFFLQAFTGGVAIDEDGRAQVDTLPTVGDVGVVLVHPFAALDEPVAVELRAGGQRLTLPLRPCVSTARGRVVDATGEPVVGAWVFAGSPAGKLSPPRSQRLLPPHLDAVGCCCARTGPDGAFEVGIVPGGGSLSLRAAGLGGRDGVEASTAESLAMPAWNGGEASLRVTPPTAGVAWRLLVNLGDGVDLGLAADETPQLALPSAGRYTVEVRHGVGDGQFGEPERRGPFDVTGPVLLLLRER